MAETGWTLDTLAKHFEDKISGVEERTKERFAHSKQAVDYALAAAEKAVTKAEVAAEKRFDSVNEFRNAMKDQQTSYADKQQTDFRLHAIERKLENYQGQATGIGASWAVLLGVISIAVGLSLLVTKFL